MYQLKPFFPEAAAASATPTKIIYKLSNYHRSTAETTNGASNGNDEELHVFDPVKAIEDKQNELIARLQRLGSGIESFIASVPKPTKSGKAPAAAAKKVEQPKVAKGAAAAAPPEEGKNKKDAKKEARKENRDRAKAQEAGGSAAKKPANAKGPAAPASGAQWVVKEEKLGAETSNSITAVVPQSHACFEAVSSGPIALHVTADDLAWVELLAKVAERRNIAFNGKIKNNAKEAHITVTVTVGAEVTASSDNGFGKVNGRIAVWKVLGAVLGVSSFAASQAVHAAHSHQWLVQADAVLSNAQFKDVLSRQASQFLSSRDSLGGQFSVCLADLVVFSLIGSMPNPPNNVELWAGRIRSLLV